VDCRTKQDRVTDLLLRVNRERSGVRTAIRNLKAQIEVIGNDSEHASLPQLKTDLRSYEDQEDEFRYLTEVITAKQSNLRMTSSDIRLLCSVVEHQIRLGEITPGNRGGNSGSSLVPPVQQPVAPVSFQERPINETTLQEEMTPSVAVDSGDAQGVLSIEDFLAAGDEVGQGS